MRRTLPRFSSHAAGLALLLVAAAARAGEAGAAAPAPRTCARLDGPVLGAGLAALLLSDATSPDRRDVPASGFDPTGIGLAIDRHAIGERDTDANRVSNWTRDAALAFPIVLGAATAPDGHRLRATLHRTLLYVEAIALGEGVTGLLKDATSRARPFTYLAAADRPAEPVYDARRDRAFGSMPSGHATSSWCAASFGIVDHLLTRPDAGRGECVAIGFAGALLATTTSALRVQAGQHFPTDVTAGAAIGIASGAGVPLLHAYVASGTRSPRPARRAWLDTGMGVLAGVGVGLLTATWIGD